MMTGSDSGHAVAGGLARHIPVLVRPAVELLDVRDGGVYIDATFGAGGYTRAILAAAELPGDRHRPRPERDRARRRPRASGRRPARAGRGHVLQSARRRRAAAAIDAVDGVVLDLGVSSMQLDEAERGFSFRHDGPLDMRMGREGPSAADVVAAASERDLAAIIWRCSARSGTRAPSRAPSSPPAPKRRSRTTGALADIVARVVHARPGAIHPATRTFQALRIFVNEELAELAAALAAAERVLKPGGRLVVVAFHSLEDRIVKTFLAARSRRSGGSRHCPRWSKRPPTFRVLTKRPIVPDEAEIAANPRARSAKLRAAERTDAPIDPLASPAPAAALAVGARGDRAPGTGRPR